MSNHATGDYSLSCPFCEFEDHDPDFLSQHVAFCHPEDPEDPVHHAPQDRTTGEEDLQHEEESTAAALDNTGLYVSCPHGCGESVARTELQLHLDLHVAESVALDEFGDLEGGSLDYTRAIAQPSDLNDTHDEDEHLHYEEGPAAHSPDIVLEGKTTGTRRRKHRKEGTKSSNKGITKLGVCLSCRPSITLFEKC
jgi:zinc finger-containing ubiquitin peptidase 1